MSDRFIADGTQVYSRGQAGVRQVYSRGQAGVYAERNENTKGPGHVKMVTMIARHSRRRVSTKRNKDYLGSAHCVEVERK